MNRTLYTLLFHLGLPLVALRLYLRARKAPAYGQRIGERFAFKLPTMRQGGIWVHAVSVGESIAAALMVRALLKAYPELPITLTCMTPTGSERIRAMFADEPRVQHCYLPYDLPWAISGFLRHFHPRIGILMETELWPNLLTTARKRGVALALVSARITDKTAEGWKKAPGMARALMACFAHVWPQDQASAHASGVVKVLPPSRHMACSTMAATAALMPWNSAATQGNWPQARYAADSTTSSNSDGSTNSAPATMPPRVPCSSQPM